ncbi:hypothetical protein CAP36_00165 [Chitinophagaceae bacterium IBVUCB2]|nr:hypothetical protein CAP36_00165 [Chitinophagaceae bacterium IBVUCB2]
MSTPDQVIEQTKKWINDVVVGCNFCPFAARVVKQQSIHYQVENSNGLKECLTSLMLEVQRLDNNETIETSFLILPNSFNDFDEYLDLVDKAETLLKKNGYEGIYQLASFHPQYLFAGSSATDAANYTNRSVYPMLHLLREESIDKALRHYTSPENIPERNVNFAREKGLVYMKMLRDACI